MFQFVVENNPHEESKWKWLKEHQDEDDKRQTGVSLLPQKSQKFPK